MNRTKCILESVEMISQLSIMITFTYASAGGKRTMTGTTSEVAA